MTKTTVQDSLDAGRQAGRQAGDTSEGSLEQKHSLFSAVSCSGIVDDDVAHSTWRKIICSIGDDMRIFITKGYGGQCFWEMNGI